MGVASDHMMHRALTRVHVVKNTVHGRAGGRVEDREGMQRSYLGNLTEPATRSYATFGIFVGRVPSA
jgi:hypothetical protein